MIVTSITTRTVKTKFGDKPVYQVTTDNDVTYGFGFKKPGFKEGDDIEFTSSEGKYGWDMDPASARVIKSGTGAPSTPKATPTTSTTMSGNRPFPIPALHGDRAIIRQNSLTNARELFTTGWGNSGVDVTDNVAVIAARIIAMAREFERYSAGDIDMEQAVAEMAKETK